MPIEAGIMGDEQSAHAATKVGRLELSTLVVCQVQSDTRMGAHGNVMLIT